jgi:hypothetical protein
MTYLFHLFVNIYPKQFFLKQNFNVDNLDDPAENQFENEMRQQPDWMELTFPF